MVSDDKHTDLLFQHYKDCSDYREKQLGLRIKLLFVVYAVQIAFVLRISYPTAFSALSGAWIAHLADGPSDLGKWLEPHFVDSLLWFILSCFITEMYSRTLVIDRETAYLQTLEERLWLLLGTRSITRTTEFRGKPILYIRNANTFYLFSTLVLVLFVSVTKLCVEIWQAEKGGPPAWISTGLDMAIFTVIVYFTVEFLVCVSRNASKSPGAQGGPFARFVEAGLPIWRRLRRRTLAVKAEAATESEGGDTPHD